MGSDSTSDAEPTAIPGKRATSFSPFFLLLPALVAAGRPAQRSQHVVFSKKARSRELLRSPLGAGPLQLVHLVLHLPILRPASPFPRRPSGPKDIGRLAIDAVGRAHDEARAIALVDAGGAHVGVELGDIGGDIRPDEKMRRDVVAGGVARFEYRVELAEGELAVGDERLGGREIARHFGVVVRLCPASE